MLKHAHGARSPGRRCSGPFHGLWRRHVVSVRLWTGRLSAPQATPRGGHRSPGTVFLASVSAARLALRGPFHTLPDRLPRPSPPPLLRSSLIWGRGAPARPVLLSSQCTQAAQPSPLSPGHQPQRHPTGSRLETFRAQQIHPESEAPPTPAAATPGPVTSVPQILPAAPPPALPWPLLGPRRGTL